MGGPPAHALDIEFPGRTVKRDVLALYDSRFEKAPHETRIHRYAEMPLNHLGFRVTYVDVNATLPEIVQVDRYRGILTWFLEPLRQPQAVIEWLDAATASGTRHVVMGELAPLEPDWMRPTVARLFGRIGLEHTGQYVELTYKSRVAKTNPAMIGFERPVDKVLPGFPVLVARGSESEAHLIIETPAAGGPLNGVVIATGPGGGFAVHDHAISFDPNTDRVRWILNPFAFFRRALGDDRFPIPDVTTLSGRRIYFSHIDGDGWNNMSEIEGYRQAQITSADVVAREAIIPFPDLPVSIGIVSGDFESALGGNPAGKRIARQLFALPQVEVASHTHTHPFNWGFFEKYDRSAEEGLIAQTIRPTMPMRERMAAEILKLAKKELPSRENDPYVAGSDELPRAYLRRPFDLALDIAGSLDAATELAPPGKPARLLLWTGDTTPFAAAIRATRLAGVRNINGGDSRLDREYPSVAYVPAIGREARGERQIYAVNSNENTYTNDWSGPYYGFFLLEQTLANTELPRRLKGFNLYYHMYSGEKPAALAAIRHFLAKARAGEMTPIAASHYATMADDFYAVEMQQVSFNSWAVTKRGAVQTVRFDDADTIVVDLAQSSGVVGYHHHAGSLYVALDSALERAVVTLAPKGTPPADAAAVTREPVANLVQGRWRLWNVTATTCGIVMQAQGFGPGDLVWRTRRTRAFRVVTQRGDKVLSEEVHWPDAKGELTLKLQPVAIEPLELRLECHD